MKRQSYLPFCLIILFILALPAQAKLSLANAKGKLLIQVQHKGEAWYVYPATGERYYLQNAEEAYRLMKKLGRGITDNDLKKIPEKSGAAKDSALTNRLKGFILLAVQQHGEAWYVNPKDGLRYYIKDGQAAMDLIRKFGEGVKNVDLKLVPMNQEQISFDYTFDQVAHVKLTGDNFTKGYNADKILPLASLTKLMTALVILDTNVDWDKKITIGADDLAYPAQFVEPGDITSEIKLAAGDTTTFLSLWRAMLIASSNQAAGVLAKNCGLDRRIFIQKMNEKAKQLGLVKTIFTDPSGLDTFNISTAQEMSKIAQAAFSRTEIADITTKSFDIKIEKPDNTSEEFPIKNRNYSLLNFGVDAAKTGFLYEAQRNVVLKKGSDIIVVLHARSMKERNNIIEKLLE